MNMLVGLFFLHTVVATIILGVLFLKKTAQGAKHFGVALLLTALAFGLWGLILVFPSALTLLITLGALAALASFVVYLCVGIGGLPSMTKKALLALGVVGVVATFIAGRFIFPTQQSISEEGLLMFNLAPFVQMLYIFMLITVSVPAIEKICKMFKGGYATLVKYLLLVQVFGGIILITSVDTMVLMTAGWIIGTAYFVLWSTLVFKKDIWN